MGLNIILFYEGRQKSTPPRRQQGPWEQVYCSVLSFTKGRTTVKLLFPESLIASQNKI
jgi:hypothetical protein